MTFSLDGADAPTHDGIRGEGSWQDVLAAVAAAGAAGVPFGVQMAVHARNESQIEQVGLLAAQLGAKHVSFAWTQPTGTAIDRSLYLSAAAWRTVHERLQALSGALRIDVIAPEGFPVPGAPLACAPTRSETLHVDVRGRLSLCCMHSGIPGPDERGVGGHVVDDGLLHSHKGMLRVIHDLQQARLDAVQSGERGGPWGDFQCNWCLSHMGRPHWVDGGAAGPSAERPRWISLRRRGGADTARAER